ncbi:hypothetical protein IM725_07190 [Ramlibacter aquaticus]|uniref:Uncharacterized protein n=1 Tax=Ramlibacter aquaticus TaxID=2780094 RepID=A0ABR9SF39_9BURK|nr:lipid II flippase MurJ [Ramlibacter aquaticus]MBE7940352.1 hypothetical protein [Ramlibacter aquaticus]
MPFVARSVASQGGEGALAVFNYAWKLVELPLVLAIQLVGTIAFPHVARAVAAGDDAATGHALRQALALAWALACAAAAGLLVGAPAVARLLFGWGRMDAAALATLAAWGRLAAWGLLPQAVAAVALTVLAARARLRPVVLAYAVALAVLLAAGAAGLADGGALMLLIDLLLAGVAGVLLAALGAGARAWLPWRGMAVGLAALLAVAGAAWAGAVPLAGLGVAASLALALLAAGAVVLASVLASPALRSALAR